MNCSEFLELYSDYRDGCLDDRSVALSVRKHLSECDACMRYDALICRGVMSLRSSGELEPTRPISLNWIRILPDSEEPASPMPTKFAGALMVAAAIALLVWPQTQNEAPVNPPPVALATPAAATVAVVLPEPKPLPARNIEPEPPVFQAQLQEPIQQVSFAEWAGLPD